MPDASTRLTVVGFVALILVGVAGLCFALVVGPFIPVGAEYGGRALNGGGVKGASLLARLVFCGAGAAVLLVIWNSLRASRKLPPRLRNWLLVPAVLLVGGGLIPKLGAITAGQAILAARQIEPLVANASFEVSQVGTHQGRHLYYLRVRPSANQHSPISWVTVESDGFVSAAYYTGNDTWRNPEAVLPKPVTIAQVEPVAEKVALRVFPELSQLGPWQWQSKRLDDDRVWLYGAVRLSNGVLTYPCLRVEVSLKTGLLHKWEADPLIVPESALVTPTVTPEQALQAARDSGAITGDATAELRYLPDKELLYIVKSGTSFVWVGAQSGKVLRDSRQP